MGRRSRRRTEEPAAPPPAPTAVSRTYRARRDELPPPPWAPLPLAELLILGGIVLVVVWLLGGDYKAWAAGAAGLTLILLGSVEVSVREHLAGMRSHTTLIAGFAAIMVMELLRFVTPPVYVVVAIGLAVFTFVWRLMRNVFIRRSGVSFRT